MGKKRNRLVIILGIFLVIWVAGLIAYARQPDLTSSPINTLSLPKILTSLTRPAPPPIVLNDLPVTASVSAQSYFVFDPVSRTVLFEKNANTRRMPASTTKIMTAIVALSEYDPAEVITVTRASEAIGHAVDLTEGDELTVIDMIKAMMINSGNDAAVSLADHHPEGYQAFVALMNQQARALKLKNTHFSNVSGVEADDHYSSAKDLMVIAEKAMSNPVFRDIVATKTAKVTTTDGKKTYYLENLNELLWDVPGVAGIKTGWTENAGDCLVVYVTQKNHPLYIVVLKSRDRFTDTKTLIDWAYANTKWNNE
jgi:D-alanyl-D-alanine carboxypeptidase (penicillin-binding protein 5/6)